MTERSVILAGGEGRRLAPYTAILPKPLMPLLDGKSIIENVLDGLAASGIRDVTITLGYLGHLIEAVVGTGERYGVEVTYTREDQPLGTAGPLTLLPNVADDDRILVVNGDTYTDLDYRRVLERLGVNREAVITCVERTINTNYGVLHFDDDQVLTRYDEKPAIPMVVSTGIYGLLGTALDVIPAGQRFDMPDLMRTLQSQGRPVTCFLSDCEWKDLGRPEDFAEIQHLGTWPFPAS